MKKITALLILALLSVAVKGQMTEYPVNPGPVSEVHLLGPGGQFSTSLVCNTNDPTAANSVFFFTSEQTNVTMRFSNFTRQPANAIIVLNLSDDGLRVWDIALSSLQQEYTETISLPAGSYKLSLTSMQPIDGSMPAVSTQVTIGAVSSKLPLADTSNYVATIVPTTSQSVIDYNSRNILSEVQFFDGLGRPVQKVQKGITPAGKDLVYLLEYDAFGRESAAWLPGLSIGTQGVLDVNVLKSAAVSLNGNDQKPYARTVYESFPLVRPVQEFGVGAAWHDAGKAVMTGYLTNTTTDAIPVYASTDDLTTVSISSQGVYAAGQLFITAKTDEDGNTGYVFTDKQGRMVLSRQMDESVAHDTYYVYDSYGNLRAVLPPLATDNLTGAATWTDSNVTLQRYAYLYRYDGRGRCIGKKLPGADWVYSVFDKYGRLVFTQDGKMRTRGEWLFSIPDGFGRVVLTGTCGNVFDYTADPLKNIVVEAIWANTTNIYKGYSIGGIELSGNLTVLTVNYYDNYEHLGKNGFLGYAYDNSMETVAQSDDLEYTGYDVLRTAGCKGMITGNITTETGNGSNPLHTVLYYDRYGRLIQSQTGNHLGGKETEYTAFDFGGNPVKRKLVHTATGKTTQAQEYVYVYDHAGRLKKASHRLNNAATWTVLAANAYDESGRLKEKKLHGSTSANTKQSYSYNVRSWITGISGGRLIENLYYNTGSGAARWNGNISSMTWKSGAETVTRGYKFTYDGLNRMSNAAYGEGSSITGTNKYGETLTYDKHGNVRTFKRYDNSVLSTSTMNYTGNQLISSSTGTYAYDSNGNMTKDSSKGITDIDYDLLNLPKKVTWSATKYAQYVYDASGTKRRTVHRNGSVTKTTDYCGSVVYEDGVLKRILFDGGYIEDGSYYYFLRDHLGNNRVVINSTGAVQQVNHFYPFGGSFASTSAGTQPYKFGGKELDDNFGLGLYDFEARQMDAGIGRFTTMDPMAERYYGTSPYAYCGNNPVRFVDPTGMSTWVIQNGNGTYKVVGGDISDGDNNVYVGYYENDEFVRSNYSIGVTAFSTSFFNSDDGNWYGTIQSLDRSGINFINELSFYQWFVIKSYSV